MVRNASLRKTKVLINVVLKSTDRFLKVILLITQIGHVINFTNFNIYDLCVIFPTVFKIIKIHILRTNFHGHRI